MYGGPLKRQLSGTNWRAAVPLDGELTMTKEESMEDVGERSGDEENQCWMKSQDFTTGTIELVNAGNWNIGIW